MGYAMKTWSNPINLDSNNLNRIELGIKNSHDALEIVSEEVANLQTKQFDILKDLKAITKDAPSILTTLEGLQEILNTNDMSAILNNADSFLTKSSQTLSSSELEQVYKNLKLNTFLKLTDIKVNDSSIVNGSEVNITLPTVDTSLNINSVNAVTNKAITKAINDIKESLNHINIDVEVPTKLSQLEQDSTHLLTTQTEKDLWNSYKDLFLLKEDYKESSGTGNTDHNHDDLYAPIQHTHEDIIAVIPVVPTNISAFTNDLNYATEEFVRANGGAISTISINGVIQTITNKNVDLTIPKDLGDLTNNAGYLKEFTETDPTVPDWAKESTKPFYDYNEILNTPEIPTDNNQLTNGAGYITESKASSLISTSLNTFKTSNITPLSNKITALESADTNIIAALEDKADADHTHTDYATTSHNHNSVYATISHTHDEYKTYTDTAIENLIGAAPSTLDTLKELADAIEANSDLISALGSTYVTLSTTQTISGTKNFQIAKFALTDTSTDFRYPLTAPTATVTDKRYLIGVASTNLNTGTASKHTNTNESVYMQNGKLYSNGTEVSVAGHTHSYSAVYTGTSATQSSNTSLSTLRLGFVNNNLYIWTS